MTEVNGRNAAIAYISNQLGADKFWLATLMLRSVPPMPIAEMLVKGIAAGVTNLLAVAEWHQIIWDEPHYYKGYTVVKGPDNWWDIHHNGNLIGVQTNEAACYSHIDFRIDTGYGRENSTASQMALEG